MQDAGTHGTLDGPEGKQVLGSVAAVSTPGLVARVVSLLQDKLLSLELWVLVTHPARRQKRQRHPKTALNAWLIQVRTRTKMVEQTAVGVQLCALLAKQTLSAGSSAAAAAATACYLITSQSGSHCY